MAREGGVAHQHGADLVAVAAPASRLPCLPPAGLVIRSLGLGWRVYGDLQAEGGVVDG